ncbi:MAG TPA: hypothetical protein VIJ94_01105 [Caulobacteraceae bacterium]
MARSLTLADLKDPREAAFVAAVFELGGPLYGAEAAMRAGYTSNPNEAPRVAAMLLGSSRISRAITGEVKARFDVATSTAFNTMLEICQDTKAPATARLSAAQAIIDRSSIGPVPSRSMSLTATVGIEELLTQLGEDGGRHGDVVEAEFSDVTPEG